MPSLPGLALRLVSSSLTLLQTLVEGAFGVVSEAYARLVDGTEPGGRESAPETGPHHGGSAIALERDAATRRPRLGEETAPSVGSPAAERRVPLVVTPDLPPPAEHDRLVALPSAPGRAFVYWHVSSTRREEAHAALGSALHPEVRDVLLVRPRGSEAGTSAGRGWRVPLPARATSRHLEDLPSGRVLELTIGIEAGETFVPLCGPVELRTPDAFPNAAFLHAAGWHDHERHASLEVSAVRLRIGPGDEAVERLGLPSSAEWTVASPESGARPAPLAPDRKPAPE